MALLYPEGDGVCYTYDAIGNMTGAMPASILQSSSEETPTYAPDANDASVEYEYDAAFRLSAITTESTEYTFVYDVFGKTTEISVVASLKVLTPIGQMIFPLGI